MENHHNSISDDFEFSEQIIWIMIMISFIGALVSFWKLGSAYLTQLLKKHTIIL